MELTGLYSVPGSSSVNNRLVDLPDVEQQAPQVDKVREPRYQNGVLRTNCIDCLDRTNVAQYAYGVEALGRQLQAVGLIDSPKIDPDSGVAAALMDMYQNMGDSLALQYGGSEAHNYVSSSFTLGLNFFWHPPCSVTRNHYQTAMFSIWDDETQKKQIEGSKFELQPLFGSIFSLVT